MSSGVNARRVQATVAIMSMVGLVLVVAAVVLYLFLAFIVRRTYPTWLFDVAVGIGAAVSVVAWVTGGSGAVTLLTVALATAWFVLTRVELRLPRRGGLSVGIGDQVPAFSATTTTGEVFTERDLVTAAPVVLVLYRGWWCPYCTTQIDEIAAEHEQLRQAGVSVYALSVDPPEEAVALENRAGGAITFLSDPNGRFLDTLGVRDTRGPAWYDRLIFGAVKQDIAAPGVLVVDDTGRIVFSYRSPRVDVRVRPREILASLS